MNCRDLRPLLARYVDGEVEGYEQTLIQQHLMSCKTCAAAVSELKMARQRVQREIKNWAASAVPPATARERLLAKLAAEKDTPVQTVRPDKPFSKHFSGAALLTRMIWVGLLVIIIIAALIFILSMSKAS
ncbi:MAG: zf-HC2 domain-containing protein [Anaerolineae bacterium]|nr:zf-HC2 domain-containing protein [Anaerolineae bacterium]